MGVGGTFEYLSDLIGSSHKHKRKQLQTVELKVRMDCDGCVLKIKNTLSSLSGVKSVEINRKQQKVTVKGYVEASKVLKKAKSTGKKAEIWPYVPYNLVAQPYAAPAYDKKAPPGVLVMSGNWRTMLPLAPSPDTRIPTLICSVMRIQMPVVSCKVKDQRKRTETQE